MKKSQKFLNICIGTLTIALIMMFAIIACSRLTRPNWAASGVHIVYAEVKNVGELKCASPVRLGGVQVGCVKKISLNPKNLRATIEIKISKEICVQLPTNTELKVVSSLPFGETFITLSVNPMALDSIKTNRMKDGDTFVRAVSYQSLENLIEYYFTNFTSSFSDKK